jgi:hypothetical protein
MHWYGRGKESMMRCSKARKKDEMMQSMFLKRR